MGCKLGLEYRTGRRVRALLSEGQVVVPDPAAPVISSEDHQKNSSALSHCQGLGPVPPAPASRRGSGPAARPRCYIGQKQKLQNTSIPGGSEGRFSISTDRVDIAVLYEIIPNKIPDSVTQRRPQITAD